jgi:drug/metabolite transporter (DMT)-like permease
VALGLAAAALFGASAPIAKRLLPGVSPIAFAGLLYLGAAAGLAAFHIVRRVATGPVPPGRRLARADLPVLAALVILGGFIGPALLAAGLARVSGIVGSLLLNLEAPATALLAIALFGDRMSRRALVSLALVVGGAVLLGFEGEGRADILGALAVAGACLAWGMDNNLTQRLSGRDAVLLSLVKCSVAGAGNLALGLLLGGSAPAPGDRPKVLALGAICYGASIVMATLALRRLGAARAGICFATAPFVGAIASLPVLGESLHPLDLAGVGVMALGVGLLLSERRPGTA